MTQNTQPNTEAADAYEKMVRACADYIGECNAESRQELEAGGEVTPPNYGLTEDTVRAWMVRGGFMDDILQELVRRHKGECMTDDQWVELFKPEMEEDGSLVELSQDDPRFRALAQDFRVWTMLDCDGDLYLSPGVHYVNRMSYHLCERPYDNKTGDVLWNKASEDEPQTRLVLISQSRAVEVFADTDEEGLQAVIRMYHNGDASAELDRPCFRVIAANGLPKGFVGNADAVPFPVSFAEAAALSASYVVKGFFAEITKESSAERLGNYELAKESLGGGEVELVSQLSSYGFTLETLYQQYMARGFETPGVWDYEISEYLGAELAKRCLAEGRYPEQEALVREYLVPEVEKFFGEKP